MSSDDEVSFEKFRKRQAQPSSTDAEKRRACEHCNSTSVSRRGTGWRDHERAYYCEHCERACHATGDPTADTVPIEEVDGDE